MEIRAPLAQRIIVGYFARAMDRPLDPREAKFVEAYVASGNAYESALKAGYSKRTAVSWAGKWVRKCARSKPHVMKAISELQEEMLEDAVMERKDLMRMWSQAACADHNEFIEHRRVCCRYCYSSNNEYQETPAEQRARRKIYDARMKAALANSPAKKIVARPEPFDELAGVFYDRRKPINPMCCECFGEGEGLVVAKDTRKLSKGAQAAFQGVKVTKDGIEIKTMGREGMTDKLARAWGLYKDDGPVDDGMTEDERPALQAAYQIEGPKEEE
jgi:phage terminase small subunit